MTLADVAARPGDRLLYRYDFGDNWQHNLLLEKVLDPEPGTTYPLCLKGKRACLPEEVGGVWGHKTEVLPPNTVEDKREMPSREVHQLPLMPFKERHDGSGHSRRGTVLLATTISRDNTAEARPQEPTAPAAPPLRSYSTRGQAAHDEAVPRQHVLRARVP